MSLIMRPARLSSGAAGPVAFDDFNRANGAFGTSSSGHAWTMGGSAWAIVSNTARPPSVGSFTCATVNTGITDVDITVDVTSPQNPLDLGLAARWVDDNNFVLMDFSLSGGQYLSRVFHRVSGSFTGLSSLVNPVPGTVAGTPFSMRLRIVGSGGEFYVNGVSLGTFTGIDASLLSSTKHGLAAGSSATTNALDSFSISAA